MKEFLNTIFQASNERLKNPLFFSFLISWIAFNWKSIFTLFLSDKKIEQKITYISENFSGLDTTLYYPILSSLIYVLVLPYFTWLIEILVIFAKTGRRTNFNNEQLSDIKWKQKIAREEREYEQERAGNVEISTLNNKINELTVSNEEKQKVIESLRIDLTELKKEKNKLEQYISLESPDEGDYTDEQKLNLDKEYESFLKTEVSTYFEQIGTEISQFKSIPKNTDPIIIEKLIFNGLISKIEDIENQRIYYLLTQKGKYFWRNYVLSKNIITKEQLESLNDLPF